MVDHDEPTENVPADQNNKRSIEVRNEMASQVNASELGKLQCRQVGAWETELGGVQVLALKTRRRPDIHNANRLHAKRLDNCVVDRASGRPGIDQGEPSRGRRNRSPFGLESRRHRTRHFHQNLKDRSDFDQSRRKRSRRGRWLSRGTRSAMKTEVMDWHQ